LAHELARRSPSGRVLLVDLDAQANASFWLCGDRRLTQLIEDGKTIDGFLEDSLIFSRKVALRDYAQRCGDGGSLDVIVSSPELRLLEREIIMHVSQRVRNLLEVERVVGELLRQQLSDLKRIYDTIIFDTAPGISAFTESALRSSDLVIVPTAPDFISNLGLEAFCKSVRLSNPQRPQTKPWVVANMVKLSAHQALMLRAMREETVANDASFQMFRTEIAKATWIEEAPTLSNMDDGPPRQNCPFAALADEVVAVLAPPPLAKAS
jgi:cellulose biosynthesis protein BcsQ